MTVLDDFKKTYSLKNIKDIYIQHIQFSNATGIDNINQQVFQNSLDDNLAVIEKKVLNGTFRFSKYRLKLISKGRGKNPREISIPTVRDRLVLRALCEFLTLRYKTTVKFELPQYVVRGIKADLAGGEYDTVIKLDVANFYPSVRHPELLKRLRRKINAAAVLSLVESALTTATVSKPSKKDAPSEIGIPQGLSISNILASIYLINIDKVMRAYSDIAYYRYVDDVLILCKKDDVVEILGMVLRKFSKIGLVIYSPDKYPEKSKIGPVEEQFSYLGYTFENKVVGVRDGSIERLKESIVSIFTSYKHSELKSQNFLMWRLNLRITGCIYLKNSKGWLFFFSEMNNETLLHELDNYVAKLLKRFGIDKKSKSFVRAFHEITHRRYETKYVPNFDTYTVNDMRSLLLEYFYSKAAEWTDARVEYEFRRKIDRQVKDLLTDVQAFGY